MRIHKAAKAIPEMSAAEFASLVQDIESHGVLVPIETIGGQIIDGRHRWKACQQLGVDPEFVEVTLNGQSPAQYVWSLNGERRHLTASQRAAVAVDLLPELKKEAKERQRLSEGRGKKGPTRLTDLNESKGDSRDKAADLVGVAASYVSDAENIKKSSGELFNQVKNGEKTIPQAKKAIKKAAKDAEDKAAAEKAKRNLKKSEDNGVFHGDSFGLAKSIPDASCALIFTDPPYDRESLPMFDELAELAGRILVDGGSLVTYCGQYVIPEVIESLHQQCGMRFFWVSCCLHTGATAQMREYGIKVKWKPMLWFVKGKFRRDRETWVEDLVVSNQEKDSHPWQQSVVEASYYIETLTRKKELVVDPFCGGGTTAVAAKRLGRQWWTADIDPKHANTCRSRLNDEDV